MSTFGIDTDILATRTPLTCAQIDGYLAAKQRGQLAGIGCAALTAQGIYGINASYIVAHAALETGWGTSRIARDKNNLFGWSAFDKSPYTSAKGFPTREHCILFVMERVLALYLTPGGKYYRGAPVLGDKTHGMNVCYATDPAWGAKIARIARTMESAFGQ